jgi:dihydrofolate reductase
MSRNRAIGAEGKIPWHLPEDFKWFKQCTTGATVLMGRKTFESLGKPLPNRTNIVLSRGPAIPGVTCISSLDQINSLASSGELWVIGGAEIYRQLLPQCSDLFLSVVDREIVGADAFFPPFESEFHLVDVPLKTAEFEVRHFRHL